MPIYTYRARNEEKSCTYCKVEFETLQKIRDDALTNCPECGAEVVRLLHGLRKIEDTSTSKMLSDDNLRKHGFKKLVKRSKGQYDEVV